MTRPLAIVCLCLSWAAMAAGSVAKIDDGQSRITATFTQMNVPVDGVFTRFDGTVDYDPSQPEQARASLDIDTASFDIGDDEYNAEIRKPEWFDSAQHPTASFTATAVHPLGADRFEAVGILKLKGHTHNVKAQVQVRTEQGRKQFIGQLPISRAAFEIGDPEWNEVLDDDVLVKFVIVTAPS